MRNRIVTIMLGAALCAPLSACSIPGAVTTRDRRPEGHTEKLSPRAEPFRYSAAAACADPGDR